ncbi:zinc finger CCCH domain-containing protein 7B-like isoform X1 [Nerophis lumbriciformis]|uniref:zinc finger CCCH domain-containing protein 7B-like isoform X1 n=2 Tax=Nerophis lumbriciformis TaxID=546530 RepID=UPI002AE07B53|nr:zinc finger CCCH domain-containing protein 7B-like isoform X1 [Nerophis lumbriciformis]XP_061830471.1 zinc finger CCCH domain-containing protein 7B-like isoform X1 [Nerophis lumbriciformis]
MLMVNIWSSSPRMDSLRQRRKREIDEALRFMQSSLAFPDLQGYQDFLVKLVCNLLNEGNCCFTDGLENQAVKDFSEGLSVYHYASAEGIQIPQALLESLYFNRATAYHSMRQYNEGVKDCDKALEVCEGKQRALYLKALCLKQLGKHKEAYDCTSACMLTTYQDKRVKELAEELANHLGLQKRKPYVAANNKSLSAPAAVSLASMPQAEPPVKTNNGAAGSLDTLDDCLLIGDDLDSLLDSIPNEHAQMAVLEGASPASRESPLVLPAPTPHLPPAFFNSGITQVGSNSAGAHKLLDALDDLCPPPGGRGDAPSLNSKAPHSLGDDSNLPRCAHPSRTDPEEREKSLDDLLSELHPVGVTSASGVDLLDSLDSLDLFPSVKDASLPALPQVGAGLDQLCNFSSSALTSSHGVLPPIKPALKSKKRQSSTCLSLSNPLAATHDFMQACSACFPRLGQGIFTFVHKADLVHTCERDILLCRRKAALPTDWTRVRQPPTWTSFTAPFVLCRELLKSGDIGLCKFGEKCTFAFNQLEIEVWTEERKGTLDRNLLFGPSQTLGMDPASSILHLMQEHKGMFLFLCQECYDSKPRIISTRCREKPTLCSHMEAHHSFDANKCLAFVVRTTNVNYRKIRPLGVLAHFALCPQVFRYGCRRDDSCQYAHSLIELQTWRVQQDTGMSPDEMVKVSSNYQQQQEEKTFSRCPAVTDGESRARGSHVNMKMNFACAQCWRGGNMILPDKSLKYCSAKAKHTWTKEQNMLLVKTLDKNKWVPVRPLPHTPKNCPAQYEMCKQILERRKCNYCETCTFAHSHEERDMWTYMARQDIRDMQQMYDMWLTLSTSSRQADGAMISQSAQEEKYIIMPTDYAEPMSGFYCRLCGKHSNSQRQWQQHISTLKHRERVFSCQDQDQTFTWNYRFPAPCFQLCSNSENDCPDGASCDSAHSPEELQEWVERRDVLRQRLVQAREDLLIMPDEFDFGKYNFLLGESDQPSP